MIVKFFIIVIISMKKKILYFSIPCMLISLGFYYLNHTNTGNFKKLNSNKKLSSLKLNERKFETSANVIKSPQIETANDNNSITKNNSTPLSKSIQTNESTDIIALFSPRNDIRAALIYYINAETEGIICAAFRFTDQQITKAFLNAAQKKIQLTFIIDKEGLSSMHSKVLHLFNSGIPVYIFPPIGNIDDSVISGLMHNKIILFLGQKIIITGSFNYTKSAQDRNRENIVIIKNNDQLFNHYLNELQIIMTESSKFQSQLIEKSYRKNKKFKKIN